mmetsp:Transcript_57658/g.158364  ORF Transcript_57658/g.158364 Transcript_57658/m.158364 type:complete len:208 (+) Transcript_57658:324-947(+)
MRGTDSGAPVCRHIRRTLDFLAVECHWGPCQDLANLGHSGSSAARSCWYAARNILKIHHAATVTSNVHRGVVRGENFWRLSKRSKAASSAQLPHIRKSGSTRVVCRRRMWIRGSYRRCAALSKAARVTTQAHGDFEFTFASRKRVLNASCTPMSSAHSSLRKMLTARRLSCPSSRRARASKEQSCAVKASTFGRDDSGALGHSSRRL